MKKIDLEKDLIVAKYPSSPIIDGLYDVSITGTLSTETALTYQNMVKPGEEVEFCGFKFFVEEISMDCPNPFSLNMKRFGRHFKENSLNVNVKLSKGHFKEKDLKILEKRLVYKGVEPSNSNKTKTTKTKTTNW